MRWGSWCRMGANPPDSSSWHDLTNSRTSSLFMRCNCPIRSMAVRPQYTPLTRRNSVVQYSCSNNSNTANSRTQQGVFSLGHYIVIFVLFKSFYIVCMLAKEKSALRRIIREGHVFYWSACLWNVSMPVKEKENTVSSPFFCWNRNLDFYTVK